MEVMFGVCESCGWWVVAAIGGGSGGNSRPREWVKGKRESVDILLVY